MDANSSYWTLVLLLAVLVVSLSTSTWAKSVHHNHDKHHKHRSQGAARDKQFFTKKCECRIETDPEGTILHDFGTIETYEFPETDCHEVHHKCRRACAEKLDLEGTMTDHTKRGLHYCDAYGHTTPKGGATLVAVWKPAGCPHHREEDSQREVQLCCGHTTVSLKPETNVNVFGWNKDCKAQSFVIAK